MESPQRAALSLVRLVAGCLIVIGLLDAGIYFTQYVIPYFQLHNHVQNQHPAPSRLNILRIILDSIPIVAGIVAFIKAKVLAEWLSDLIE